MPERVVARGTSRGSGTCRVDGLAAQHGLVGRLGLVGPARALVVGQAAGEVHQRSWTLALVVRADAVLRDPQGRLCEVVRVPRVLRRTLGLVDTVDVVFTRRAVHGVACLPRLRTAVVALDLDGVDLRTTLLGHLSALCAVWTAHLTAALRFVWKQAPSPHGFSSLLSGSMRTPWYMYRWNLSSTESGRRFQRVVHHTLRADTFFMAPPQDERTARPPKGPSLGGQRMLPGRRSNCVTTSRVNGTRSAAEEIGWNTSAPCPNLARSYRAWANGSSGYWS